MTERLRYTGAQPVTFLTGDVGPVDPGGEFDVAEDLAPRFLRRPDVEHAGECPGGDPCRCGEKPATDPDASAGDDGGGVPPPRIVTPGTPPLPAGTTPPVTPPAGAPPVPLVTPATPPPPAVL
jgi:hypothetical protein